jgi:hypothetical protein
MSPSRSAQDAAARVNKDGVSGHYWRRHRGGQDELSDCALSLLMAVLQATVALAGYILDRYDGARAA